MRKSDPLSPLLAATVLLSFLFSPTYIRAQTPAKDSIRIEMAEVYAAFKQLQPYLLDGNEYANPNNRERILELISRLNDNFHTIETFDSEYLKQPGFPSRIESLLNILHDAKRYYHEGAPRYSLMSLRTLSNHCLRCHSTYSVRVDLHERPENLSRLPLFVQGEFYLLSRDFERARARYYKAALRAPNDLARMDSLLKWLMVSVQYAPNPNKVLHDLELFQNRSPLNEYDQFLVDEWIASLTRWRNEKRGTSTQLDEAEELLERSIPGKDLFDQSIDLVTLLRTAALLEPLLQKPQSTPERKRALYLAGMTYSKLPPLLTHELPEVYFEQCIREFPGTHEAQLSYRLYHNLVTDPYLFASQNDVPPIVRELLGELHQLAFVKNKSARN